MEPLELNRKIFILFGLYPTGERPFARKHLLRLLFSFIIFQFEFLGVFSTSIFIVTHIKADIERAINCTLQLSALFGAVYSMILGLIFRTKIIKIFGEFLKIHEDSKLVSGFLF